MTRFYGKVLGQASTEATRIGSPKSGLRTACNGWNVGAICYIRDANGADCIDVYASGGLNDKTRTRLIARIFESGLIEHAK